MAKASSNQIAIYLEIGSKRTIAYPLEWPGWCRSGKDEGAAIAALLAYGPRYQKVLAHTQVGFTAPDDASAFAITERLTGNATTDFGVPGLPPAYDVDSPDAAEFERARTIIRATWRAFDRAIEAARGKELTTGPRGGGRDLDKMIDHVDGADRGYLRSIGHKLPSSDDLPLEERLEVTRRGIMAGLDTAEQGNIPEHGPRGGKMWTARYYVRRSTWHTLDHAWELEDRTIA